MAQNTLEIWIKANASKAQATLRAFDKELNKFGIDTGKGFSILKAKWSEFDAMLSTPKGFKTLLGTAASVAGSLAGVGLAIKKLSDDYMDYAFQVKDFGRIIGATPEEASKLIQVADDVRLSVGSMTTALRSAITKGYEPTIEGLGKLADQYNAIQDPIAKSKFLVETFGRSGLEMAKLLELGSQKIQEMGDSIEGTGRLMTEEGIAKAQAYYEALDQLGDAAESAKLSLGGELLPAVTGVATETAKLAESGGDLIGMFMRMQNAVDDNIISGEQFLGLLAGYTIGTRDYAEVLDYLDDKEKDAMKSQDALTNAVQAGFFAYNQAANAANSAANANEDLADSADQASKVYGEASSALREFTDDMKLQVAAQQALDLAIGKTTPEQIQMNLLIERATRLLDQGTISIENWTFIMAGLTDGTMTAAGAVQLLNGYLKSLPKETRLKVYIEQYGVTVGTKPGETRVGGEAKAEALLNPPGEKAIGGPVMPYQSYIVGERGPELFVPNMSGRIIPNSQVSNITNQPTTITNTFILPQQTNVRELARLVYKEQQRAGVT